MFIAPLENDVLNFVVSDEIGPGRAVSIGN